MTEEDEEEAVVDDDDDDGDAAVVSVQNAAQDWVFQMRGEEEGGWKKELQQRGWQQCQRFSRLPFLSPLRFPL